MITEEAATNTPSPLTSVRLRSTTRTLARFVASCVGEGQMLVALERLWREGLVRLEAGEAIAWEHHPESGERPVPIKLSVESHGLLAQLASLTGETMVDIADTLLRQEVRRQMARLRAEWARGVPDEEALLRISEGEEE